MDAGAEGMTGVAVPIFEETGVFASLLGAVLTARIGERLGEMAVFARSAVREISHITGAAPSCLLTLVDCAFGRYF